MDEEKYDSTSKESKKDSQFFNSNPQEDRNNEMNKSSTHEESNFNDAPRRTDESATKSQKQESADDERTSHTSDEEKDGSQKKKKTKKKEKIYGSLDKDDIPAKVIGVRPVPELNDLEVLVSWKARKDGTQPDNSKVMRLDLLKKNFWMPLIEFYESKMKLESVPNFNPSLLPKYSSS
jgi:hypothetical protein